MLRRSFLVALAGITLAAACGGDSATGPDSIVGTYTLQTVNGVATPVTVFQDASGRVEVTGGRVSLNADGTFSDAIDLRLTSGQTVLTTTETAVGTYVRSGDNITFNVTGAEPYRMAISGRTLTQVEEGFTLVYRR
jgi:ABC-type glycerol-3-phosphate transport system substrate-binding protein